MGFFGLFKKKPMQPKAPQFAPPPSPDAPSDLLDEFPDHSPKDGTSSLQVPPAPSWAQQEPTSSIADVSDSDVDESNNSVTNDTLDLPDFSSDEIDVAKQLEQKAKNLFSPGWEMPLQEAQTNETIAQEDDLPDLLTPTSESSATAKNSDNANNHNWSAPLEHLDVPVGQTFNQAPSFDVPNWSQNDAIEENNQDQDIPKTPTIEQSLKQEDVSNSDPVQSQEQSALAFDDTQFAVDEQTPSDDFTDIPSPFEIPSSEQPLTQNEMVAPLATPSDSKLQPWEEDPLPTLEEPSSEQIAYTPATNEMFLPILQYKDALQSSKALKDELKRGNTHLSTTLRYMNQHKAKFSEFAEDLRSIEVDLLRMDEVLR